MYSKHRVTAWIMILALLFVACVAPCAHAEKSYKLTISLAENEQFSQKDKIKINIYRIATASESDPADWHILPEFSGINMTAAASSYSNMVKHAEDISKILKEKSITPEYTGYLDRDGIYKMNSIAAGVVLLTIAEAPEGFAADPYLINVPAYNGKEYVEETHSIIKYEYKDPTPPPPPPATLHGKKVDTEGKPIQGAQFELRSVETNQVVSKATSDANGLFDLKDVVAGDWLIQEVVVPDGYIKMDDIRIHVDEDHKVPELIACVNIPDHYEFMKVDNNGNPIKGVKFTVEDASGNIIAKPVSSNEGLVSLKKLSRGKYVIRETEPAEGFMPTNETIVFTIDDNYIAPTVLHRFVNYPIIQTGISLENPYMVAGFAVLIVALAGIILVIVQKRKFARN